VTSHLRWRRSFTIRTFASVFAIAVALQAAASPVVADCEQLPPPTDVAASRGIAFTATIAGIAPENDLPVLLTLNVEHVYWGDIPDRLVIYNAIGCSTFALESMHVGQRLLLSARRLGRGSHPGTSAFLHPLLWRQV
jgi:hypothetical protein